MNLTYKATCKRCEQEGRRAEYLGETSKSLTDRAAAHLKSLKGTQSSSFMLRHNLLHHPNGDPYNVDYCW